MQPDPIRLGVYPVRKAQPLEWKMDDVPGEPEGWRELQERAQQETDPKKLAAIIDEMNKLLAEQEGRAGGGPPAKSSATFKVKLTPQRLQ